MNKVYKVIWNHSAQRWDVVSELTGAKKKSKSSRVGAAISPLVLLTALTLNPGFAYADIMLPNNWLSSNQNNGVGAAVVNGTEENIIGPGVISGPSSGTSYMSITDAQKAGYIISGDDLSGLVYTDIGKRTRTVQYYDSITGANQTVMVYDSGTFSESEAASNVTVPVFSPGANFFYKTRLVTAKNGGTANIDVKASSIGSYFKDSQLVVADGTNSHANWNSQNNFYFQAAARVTDSAVYNKTINFSNYTGSFTDWEGKEHVVNSVADLQSYNDYLAEALKDGRLPPGQYEAEFNKAIQYESKDYIIDKTAGGTIDSSPYNSPVGTLAVLSATNGGTVTLSSSGRLTGVLPAYGYGAGVVASSGGTGINEGVIDATGAAMRAYQDGTVINNGTIYVWDNNTKYTLHGEGMLAHNANAKAVNNGVINVRPWKNSFTPYGINTAMLLSDGGEGTNNGVINITADASTLDNNGATRGISVSDGGTFINAGNGKITVGVNAGGTKSHSAVDSIAIDIGKGATKVVNEGDIILGQGAQGDYGVSAVDAGTVNFINTGTISVEGQDSATPALNAGIRSSNSSGLVNSGIINVNGTNNSGILAENGGSVLSDGLINVGSVSAGSGYRNYGAWVDGAASSVDVSGQINLIGSGAIGAFADNAGSLILSGTGSIAFNDAEQIGFYVNGKGSSVNNTGSGTFDVSSRDSSMFRIAGGASFLGNSDASSTITVSGENSLALVVTGSSDQGDVSTINTGGMAIQLSGNDSTGLRVEGGALGTIDANTTINLNAVSSIAAVADGNGYDISGNLINKEDNATSLTASAQLTSSLDSVTGYIARNGASLDNAGDIIFTGSKTTGMRVEEGATGTNSGNITVEDGGAGLIAASGGKNTVINNTGNLILKGGDNANRTTGIKASGPGTVINMNAGNIELQGQGAVGVEVSDEGTVNLIGSAVPQFADESTGITDQIAFRIKGSGAQINTSIAPGTLLDATGKDSILFRIEDGAQQAGTLQMKTSGTGSSGIWVTGTGSKVVAGSGSDFQILGDNAKGLYVTGGAEATLEQGVSVNLVGDGAIVAEVDGNAYGLDGSVTGQNTGSVLTNEADITTALSNATGFITRNQGLLVNNGNIDFTAGTDNIGILVDDGRFENSGNSIAVNGVALHIKGANSQVNNTTGGDIIAVDGEAAIKLGAGASLDLAGDGFDGSATIEGRGSAHGILLDTGATGLKLNGAVIKVSGLETTGHGIENRAEIEGIQLSNGARINVSGGGIGIRTAAPLAKKNQGVITVRGATGIAFQKADGSATDGLFDISDSSELYFDVEYGTGILVNTTADAVVKTNANIWVYGEDGGSAIVVKDSASEVVQSGEIFSASLINDAIIASRTSSFINEGTIFAYLGTAISFSDDVDSTLKNHGNIDGKVKLNGGNNTLINNGSVGALTAGDGNNTLNLNDGSYLQDATLGNGNNTIIFSGFSMAGEIVAGTGENTFIIKDSDGLRFDLLDGGMGDSDKLIFDHAQYFTLDSAGKIKNIESVRLDNDSDVTIREALLLTDNGAGPGSVDIHDDKSELSVRPSAPGGFTFDPRLTGEGLLSVELDAAESEFSFSQNVGNAFSGTLALGKSNFVLDGINTESITNAMLISETDNTTIVGDGTQHIGGLGIDGGKLIFGTVTPGDTVASNSIVTSEDGLLDISGKGTVQVTLPGEVVNVRPVPDTQKNILEQDDAETLVTLVEARGAVKGTGAELLLTDENGGVISDSQSFDITQDGTPVARGTYDYKLMSSKDGISGDGLYIGYGLKSIELQGIAGNALILTPKDGARGQESDLNAQLTGTGDLAIDAGSNTVTLSNGSNGYTGSTRVLSGTLKMANDNVLGQTADLAINNGAAFITDGFSQHVGAIQTEAGAGIQLDAGSELTIDSTLRASGEAAGGVIEDSALYGEGRLVVSDSSLEVKGQNSKFTGDVTLESGSVAELENAQGLGSLGTVLLSGNDDTLKMDIVKGSNSSTSLTKSLAGKGTVDILNNTDLTLSGDNSNFSGTFDIGSEAALHASDAKHLGQSVLGNEGSLYLTANNDWELTNEINGAGSLTKQGSGNLIINRELSYTGATRVESGTMVIGDNSKDAAGVLSGTSVVTVNAGAMLAGTGTIAGNVENKGTIAALNSLSGYSDAGTGNFTVGALNNTGTLLLAGSETGNTLTVNGDYHGEGKLVLNTVLGGDDSLTDKLIVKGNASGKTDVYVTNVGGSGAQTQNGIEVVQVDGQSADDSFRLAKRAVGGAYEYYLHKGDINGAGGDWYLRSELSPAPEPDTTPGPDTTPEPEPNPTPEPAPAPTPAPEPDQHGDKVYRPEAGSYIAGIAASNTLFNTRLHDRAGETYYTDVLTGEQAVTSMWMRHVGGHNVWKDGSSQLNTQSNRYVLQLGGDIAQWTDGKDRLHLGVMGGYGNEKSSTTSSLSHYKSRGTVNGYSLGMYATWQQNEGEESGAYVDTWAQYSWFDNTVKGEQLAQETWKSSGITASAEAGYTFNAGKFKGSHGSEYNWYIQPQAQITWMNVRSEDHREHNGTKISAQGEGNVQSRVGLRTYLKGKSHLDSEKERTFEPFIEANWIHNTRSWGVRMDDALVTQDGARDVGEIKTGVEGQISKNLNVWGNVGVQIGDKGYNDTQAMLGIKYSFK
ncbi:autotransporter outer membrane beta-barrel domain-containing protein [Enterobacter hormaechei]|uniref:autotransporter outer membrane beta-barrel domain-containing protein n=1 Tax=Enterobacter hormaechei TaxID=158836 RepID=UPI000735814F|nr:autotransporter outer membrane beta-barrel domain-containing protein [Enterobacter hormaechei]KTI04360.1 autotransporter outer membrane beta-barrel domain-containing protein [Enterobacter hormaechei subsp. xiangfangensis]KTI94303.1 autotransporter outer membrane beta-barrel domain-containing protein [Enterobacter hormaechei subsp. xiangfangensis]HAS1742909.1 autotransporter outer membrane beta-barrel domain-containing protein [Enterobacter hormaechei subsp. oharae]HAS1752925.1 autotransporte